MWSNKPLTFGSVCFIGIMLTVAGFRWVKDTITKHFGVMNGAVKKKKHPAKD